MQAIFKNSIYAAAFLSTTALSGCVGEMQGVERGSGAPVKFSFEQGMDSDSLTATMNGEQFNGKSVPVNSGAFFGNTFGGASFYGSTSGNKYVATLFGSKGSTMRCDVTYADAGGFTASGGVGVCQHSNGRFIDVMW